MAMLLVIANFFLVLTYSNEEISAFFVLGNSLLDVFAGNCELSTPSFSSPQA